MPILISSNASEVVAAVATATLTDVSGVWWERRPTDLAAHWENTVRVATGLDLNTLFDVNLIDIQRRLDISTDGSGKIEIEWGSFGRDRLAYEVHAITPVNGKTLLASGQTDAFDTPEILRKHAIPGIDVRVVYTGAVDFDGPADLAIDAGADMRVSIGGELVASTGGGGARRFTYTPEYADAPLALEVEVLSPAADRARRANILIETGKDQGDFFDIVRAPSEKTLVAEITLDGVSQGVFAFEEIAALSDLLDRLSKIGSVAATVEGSFFVETPGSYTFALTGGARNLVIGTSSGQSGIVVAPLPFGRNPFTFDVAIAGGATDDMNITVAGPDTGGGPISLTGRRAALTDGLLDLGDQLLADFNALVDPDALSFLSSFSRFKPTFDAQVGMDAVFGWDIDIDGLGRTATEQPVSFVFQAPTTIRPGQSVILNVTDMVLAAPTTRSAGLEISKIDVNAGFDLPETQISNIGVEITTANPSNEVLQALFGANPLTSLAEAFDQFATLKLQLDATLDLDDAVGVARELAAALGVKGNIIDLLDIGGFFRGLFSGEVNPVETIKSIAAAVKAKDFAGVVDIILGIIAAGQAVAPGDEPPVLVTVRDTMGSDIGFDGAAFVPIVTEAALIGSGADRYVTTTVEGLGAVRLPVAAVLAAAETSGINDLFASLRAAFSEGVEPVEGLKISADLPLNTFAETTGFGDGGPATRNAATQIVATSEASLLSVDVDVEKVVREALIKIVDEAISTPGLPPKVLAVLVASRIALALQPLYVETLQQGASAELELNPGPLIGAALDGFADLFAAATDAINDLLGKNLPPPDFTSIDFTALLADRDALAAALDVLLTPLTDALNEAPAFILGAINQAASDAGDLLTDGAALLRTGLAGSVGAAQTGLNAIADLLEDAQTLANDVNGDVNAVRAVLSGFDSQLQFATSQLGSINAFANTIKNAPNTINSAINGVLGGINSTVKSIINTPIIGAGAKPIFQSFGFVFDGANNINFESGLFAGIGTARSAINGITNLVNGILTDVSEALPPLDLVRRATGDVIDIAEEGLAALSQALSGLSTAIAGVRGVAADLGTALAEITKLADSLVDAAAKLDATLQTGINLDFGNVFDGAKQVFVDTLADAAQGINLRGNIDFNFEDLAYAFDLKLKQTTVFNPEAVKVEYVFGDEKVIADYGQAVRFDVPADITETPKMGARLLLDGAYDYIYTLKAENDIDYQLFGFSIFGELKLGDRDPVALGNPFDPDSGTFDYALLKLVDDYDLSNPASLFDDALIEIPVNLVIEKIQGILYELFLNKTRALFDKAVGIEPIGNVPLGEIGLFRINGVPATNGTLGFAPVEVFLSDTMLTDKIRGGDGNDPLAGSASADTIEGLAGNDSLSALAGNDRLLGDADDDTLDGGADNDTLDGGTGADSMIGGGGNDLYVVDNAGDRILETRPGGADTVYSSVTWGLGPHLEALVLTGDAAIDGTGNNLANLIVGNDAANVLNGGGRADTLIGGGGDDLYLIDATDVLVEQAGGGNDTVVANATFALPDHIEVLRFNGTANVRGDGNAEDNFILGNVGNNRLLGNDGNDTLNGGLGNDTLLGGEGADSLVGGEGVDRLDGGNGNDTYLLVDADLVIELANAGIDTVLSNVTYVLPNAVENLTLLGSGNIAGTGNTLDNVLIGNGGANLLRGLGGADSIGGGQAGDTLEGGAGADTLAGSGGADHFLWLSPAEGGDTLVDFRAGEDKLAFAAAGFGGLAVVTLSQNAAAGGTAQFIYTKATGVLEWDADGTGGIAAVTIATLSNKPTLAAADFVIA